MIAERRNLDKDCSGERRRGGREGMFPAGESSVNRRQRQWVGRLVPAHIHMHTHTHTADTRVRTHTRN